MIHTDSIKIFADYNKNKVEQERKQAIEHENFLLFYKHGF